MGGPYCQWRRPYVRVELNSEQADTVGEEDPWGRCGVGGGWGKWQGQMPL